MDSQLYRSYHLKSLPSSIILMGNNNDNNLSNNCKMKKLGKNNGQELFKGNINNSTMEKTFLFLDFSFSLIF